MFLGTGPAERPQVAAVGRSVSEPSTLFMAQMIADHTGMESVVTIGEGSSGNRHMDAYQQAIDRERYFTLEPILLRRRA